MLILGSVVLGLSETIEIIGRKMTPTGSDW